LPLLLYKKPGLSSNDKRQSLKHSHLMLLCYNNNHIKNFVKNTLMQLKKCIKSTSKRP